MCSHRGTNGCGDAAPGQCMGAVCAQMATQLAAHQETPLAARSATLFCLCSDLTVATTLPVGCWETH